MMGIVTTEDKLQTYFWSTGEMCSKGLARASGGNGKSQSLCEYETNLSAPEQVQRSDHQPLVTSQSLSVSRVACFLSIEHFLLAKEISIIISCPQ
jgi:hypothetical protein